MSVAGPYACSRRDQSVIAARATGGAELTQREHGGDARGSGLHGGLLRRHQRRARRQLLADQQRGLRQRVDRGRPHRLGAGVQVTLGRGPYRLGGRAHPVDAHPT